MQWESMVAMQDYLESSDEFTTLDSPEAKRLINL